MADPAGPFGSSIEGIEGLLPWRSFEEDSSPTREQVIAFLTGVGARVSARIGTLEDVTDPAVRSRLTDLARWVVVLGAAAQAEAAAVPETANAEDVTSYAAWLRSAFDEAFAELVTGYEEALEDEELGGGGAGGEPGWSFPDPAGLIIRGV